MSCFLFVVIVVVNVVVVVVGVGMAVVYVLGITRTGILGRIGLNNCPHRPVGAGRVGGLLLSSLSLSQKHRHAARGGLFFACCARG